MRTITTSILLAMLCLLQACNKEISAENLRTEEPKPSTDEKTAYLKLHFKHTVDGAPLELGANYQNSMDEDFVINKLKYYISNIAMYHGTEGDPIPDTYFLVDAAVDSSTTITLPIEAGMYQNLDIMLGVDSARNVSGAQTGALDPLHDMFWTWNTGYIMMKLEGNSTVSTAPNNRIQYHIGGFNGPFSALRNIGVSMFSPVELKNGQTLDVTLVADLLRWFDGVHELSIQSNAVSMTPDEVSSQYADNGAAMIQVTSVSVK
jgi:hypothetical protein